MSNGQLEFGEVRMSLQNGGKQPERAERISRLVFERLQQMLERERQHLGSSQVIDHLEVPSVDVSLETMDDQTIAGECAEAIYRSLLRRQ
ncbi:MAG: hypothetical protein ISS70_18350 [Phycisphaerae bacterium]|nr:hypothetical protein [Phycisphaerae bacterium]